MESGRPPVAWPYGQAAANPPVCNSLIGFRARVPATIYDQLFVSQNIVHVGALLYLLGFLFRDQLVLRGLVILGDLVYILYFYFAPDIPLWGGIFWSVMFTIVNVVMIWFIYLDEVQFSLPTHERKLFELLVDLTPGQFRTFLKAGRQGVATSPLVITRENKPLDQLYFVTDGKLTIDKGGSRMVSEAKTFIGEIAFLLARPATATVTLEPGCHYGVWDSKALRNLLNGNAALKMALSAALNRKLAEKVAQAGVLTDVIGDTLEASTAGAHAEKTTKAKGKTKPKARQSQK